MPVDWSGLQAPNIFAAFQNGQEQGRQARQDRQMESYRQAQIAKMDSDTRRAEEEQARILGGRQQAADALGRHDYDGARSAAVGSGDTDMFEQIGKLDAEHRAHLKEHNGVLGQYMQSLAGLPPEEVAKRWAIAKPRFLANGFDPESVDFDPTQPGVIEQEIAEAGMMDDMLKRVETERHNKAMEGKPGLMMRDADGNWVPNETFIAAQGRAAAAKRAPPRPRAAGGGGGASLPPGYVPR